MSKDGRHKVKSVNKKYTCFANICISTNVYIAYCIRNGGIDIPDELLV